ncbi:MAG: hypothetical protein JWQ96_1791, partial [Segetibacter sp.]|nr:hypothetical protein [Segetibacter sp.]
LIYFFLVPAVVLWYSIVASQSVHGQTCDFAFPALVITNDESRAGEVAFGYTSTSE